MTRISALFFSRAMSKADLSNLLKAWTSAPHLISSSTTSRWWCSVAQCRAVIFSMSLAFTSAPFCYRKVIFSDTGYTSTGARSHHQIKRNSMETTHIQIQNTFKKYQRENTPQTFLNAERHNAFNEWVFKRHHLEIITDGSGRGKEQILLHLLTELSA